MTEKIVVKDLYKVFGDHPDQAMQMINDGIDKDEIFDKTGQTVGVCGANFTVHEGEIFVVQIRGDFLDEKLAQLSTDKDLNLLRDDARTLVDGHFGVESERWGIFAWVENLLNVKYIVNQGANGYLGFIEQLWGQPRLVGLRFTYKF